jgi:hypothetical protein
MVGNCTIRVFISYPFSSMPLKGYCVQSSWVFPWALTSDGTPFPPISLSPPEQWDVLPFASKAQILLFIGFLEFFNEFSDEDNGNVSIVWM